MEKALADKTKECEQAMESATKKHEIGLRWQKAFTENRATLETRVKEVESKQAEITTLQAEVERLTKEAAEGVAAKDEELETLKKDLEALKAQVAQSSASDSPAMVSAHKNLLKLIYRLCCNRTVIDLQGCLLLHKLHRRKQLPKFRQLKRKERSWRVKRWHGRL